MRDNAGPPEGQKQDRGLAGYRPLPGVPDELVLPDGRLRPLWRGLVDYLESLGDEALARIMGRADQYLQDSGVIYRQYGVGQSVERPWPLSHLPMLIDQADWDRLSSGLIQRARALEALMADLYGPNRMVAEGYLPPRLLADNREWLRPMVGVRPRSGHFLHVLAFELGRDPAGNWAVMADRAQAPSGLGYALENRVATARAYAEIYPGQNVHRLAGFFREFRGGLMELRHSRDGRVGILSPGPLNETYFEQAWLARYLGVVLVQGEDLVVENNRLMLRTVAGLRPMDVLWRRLDSNFADPMELDPRSRLGTPGLMAAMRGQGLTMVNALGSGVLESRSLMGFLPVLAPHLLGETLALPSMSTLWCGAPGARAAVMANPDQVVLSPANGSGLPWEHHDSAVAAASLTPAALAQRLEEHGPSLVAQQVLRLSTTPALVDGRLVPRPMSLRVFLARNPAGDWVVMPGGFARIGGSAEPTAIAMQRGGGAADVWIVSPEPVAPDSMVAGSTGPYQRVDPGVLASRAADNLFWLGRYVERTEGLVRLLRARNIRLADGESANRPLLRALEPLLEMTGIDTHQGIPDALIETLGSATACAGQVRDLFSTDAWAALSDLDKTARRMAERVTLGDDAARALSALLRKLAGFSGLVHENMYHANGWRFLTIGRRHERAMGISAMLGVLADPGAPEGALDLCVELADSVMTHRRRFAVETRRETVIDLLALDPMNPRSIRHQLDVMHSESQRLPDAVRNGQLSPMARAMLQLQTEVTTTTAEALTTEALYVLRGRIAALSELLTEAWLR